MSACFSGGRLKGSMLALMFELICAASPLRHRAGRRFLLRRRGLIRASPGLHFIGRRPLAWLAWTVSTSASQTVVSAMLADEGVRLPVARNICCGKKSRD